MRAASARVGLLALLCAAALALLAVPARAGTYEVVACGGAAGGAQNAFGAAADAGMAAYKICPPTPSDPATGLVTRASANAGPASVPYFAGAYQIFEAPQGASLESVSFDVAAIRLAINWTTGIVAYDGDFNFGSLPYGCYAWTPGCSIGSRAFFGPVSVALGGHTRFRFETRCVDAGGCDVSASGFTPGMRALFSAANVRVRVQDFTRPFITPASGALWSGGWHRGYEEAWQSLRDNVGIMALRLRVDGTLDEAQDYRDAAWPAGLRCDFTRPTPCSNVYGGVSLDTRALTDGAHAIRIEAVDAAGNEAAIERQIRVDNSAPVRVNANVEGGDAWHQRNSFAVRWPSPAGQTAPIARAHYRLCSARAPPGCLTRSAPLGGAGRLDGLAVPRPGDYTLQLWLEDEAGNVDPTSASDPIHLRFDDVAPAAAFELLDENDPRRVDVRVSDGASGAAGGAIELRRAGHRQWHPLSTSFDGERLAAYLDDLALPDGHYELRARVRDRAGNEELSYLREDGARMELTLPLRAASRIVLRSPGKARKGCRKRRRAGRKRCRIHRAPRAGDTLAGRLETGNGKPVAESPIPVFEQPRTGGGFRRLGTLRTNGRGGFAYTIGHGPSRTIRLGYEGTALVKPAARSLRLRVPARTTIVTSRRSLRNGESVRFSGHLLGRPLPLGGKLIDLQAHYRGRWRTFATPRSDAAGRWRFRYRFEATRGVVTYRFRARIRREAAYPYELGYSRVVAVTVRGR